MSDYDTQERRNISLHISSGRKLKENITSEYGNKNLSDSTKEDPPTEGVRRIP